MTDIKRRRKRRNIKIIGPIEAQVAVYGPKDRNPRQKCVPLPREWPRGTWVRVERIDLPTFPPPEENGKEEGVE